MHKVKKLFTMIRQNQISIIDLRQKQSTPDNSELTYDSIKLRNCSQDLHQLFLSLRLQNQSSTKAQNNSEQQKQNQVLLNQKKDQNDFLNYKGMRQSQLYQFQEQETPFFNCSQQFTNEKDRTNLMDLQTQPHQINQKECVQIQALQNDSIQKIQIFQSASSNKSQQSIIYNVSLSTKESLTSLSKQQKVIAQVKQQKNRLFFRQNRWKQKQIIVSQKRVRIKPLKFWLGQRLIHDKRQLSLKKMRQIIDFVIHKDSIDEIDYYTTSIYTDSEIQGFIRIDCGKVLRLNVLNQSLKYKISCREAIIQEKDHINQSTNIIIMEIKPLVLKKVRKTLQLSQKKQYGSFINQSFNACIIQIKIRA